MGSLVLLDFEPSLDFLDLSYGNLIKMGRWVAVK